MGKKYILKMKNKLAVILVLLFGTITAHATPPFVKGYKLKRFGMTVGASTVFSFFKTDTRMSEKRNSSQVAVLLLNTTIMQLPMCIYK